MNNIRNLALFYNQYLQNKDSISEPVGFYKDTSGSFLVLGLKTDFSCKNKNPSNYNNDEDDVFYFRLYDGFANNIILMNQDKIAFILSQGAHTYHCYNFIHPSGGIIVDIPIYPDKHKGNVSKMVEGIRLWMCGFNAKRANGIWLMENE